MKKTAVTILAVLYIITSSGAVINFHYCMGRLIGWDISGTAAEQCSNCGMSKENKKGCCQDKRQILTLKKDQVPASQNKLPNNTFCSVLHSPVFERVSSQTSPLFPNLSTGDPPRFMTIAPFIFNCIFRI